MFQALPVARAHVPVALVPGLAPPSAAVRSALVMGPPWTGADQEFEDLHQAARQALAPLFGAAAGPVILAGPPALGAWSAARSTIRVGERALVLVGGPLATQLCDAVAAAGAELCVWPMPPGRCPDLAALGRTLRSEQPTWVGLVYCEPEHATQWPLFELVRAIRADSDALVCVDARAGLVAAPLAVDDWGIDLCLASADLGLAVPIDAALVTVSGMGWRRVTEVGFQGWEALARWRDPSAAPGHPYAPGASALHALTVAARELLIEGPELVRERHESVARYARERIRRLALPLFPADAELAAPGVSAGQVPPALTWAALVAALAERGVALGRGQDDAGRPLVLCSHLGTQAELALVKRALDALADVVAQGAEMGG